MKQQLTLRAVAFAFTALLAACSGGSHAPSLPPTLPQGGSPISEPDAAGILTATPTPMPSVIVLKSGAVIGADNRFTPSDGDTSSGGNGQTIASILPCKTSMYETYYHVHAFVGILVNKVQMALPDAVGMYLYGSDVNGYTNTAKCFYYIHTHDASGMVHIESPSTASLGSSLYTFGNLLQVWGMNIGGSYFGPFSGTVHVYVATTPLRNLYSGTYYAFTGDPHTIKLYSHEAIWIEVGNSYYTASQLPKIRFYTEY